MSPEEKLVVVTGGSRGLGLGIVVDLLKQGYPIATCSRSRSGELDDLLSRHSPAGGLFWRACRVGQEAEEEEFMSAALEWAGERKLYGLINNAGIAGDGILATFPKVDIEEIIRVNLLGAIRMARLALRAMLTARAGGRIINIGSIIGSSGSAGLAAYAASKAGLDGLTRSLAREAGPRGITVNSVAPGYLETDMSNGLSPDERGRIVRRTPAGRLGAVADVVPLIRFLLSEDASFITGQSIRVDGGIGA